MLVSLIAFTALLAPQTVELTPTDDVWVYPHAGDPQTDEFLRVWGTAGQAVSGDPAAAEEYGYSYLRFDISKLPNKKPTSAELVLIHVPDPGWQPADSKSAPLEVRILNKDFTEKTWDYGKAKDIFPPSGKGAVVATTFADKVETGKPVVFRVDLMKDADKFKLNGNTVTFALTSSIDPANIGNQAVYKFYSKDTAKAELRPKLILKFPEN
jgi:hypothetical protein